MAERLKAEGSMLKISFGTFINRRENGGKLACFVEQIGHLRGGNTAAVHEQFEPILGFFDFFETIADFGNELRFGSAAGSLAIVRATDVPERKTCLPST